MTDTQRGRRRDAQTPRVDRRAFVRLGLAGGGAALAAACGWDGGGAIRPLLLDWSRVNDWVGEKVFFSPTHLAQTYSPAERSAMLPSYFISDMTPMLGYKLTKYLVSMTFTDTRPGGYWEDQGYPWFGGI